MQKRYFDISKVAISLCLIIMGLGETVSQTKDSLSVFVFDIRTGIDKPAQRTTQLAFDEAQSRKADYILIHLNTYGGRVDIADSISTRILNSPIPVLTFVDNRAISAGALIAIACDSIYMRAGGSIGAATVVNQSGEQVPDKYQSFMRATMRATAESHGKDTIINGTDTLYVWHRDPAIAETMVDPVLSVNGVSDSGQVLTLTADEAIKVNFCEGKAENIKEVLQLAGLEKAEVYYFKPEGVSRFILFMLNPIVQSILIILIIGGIYFEFQTPGVGFPLGAAILAALLFFTPLYIENLAENWELLMFLAGIVLIALEIFVIPGFGVAGVAGIGMVLGGLVLSLLDNVRFNFDRVSGTEALGSLGMVTGSVFIAFVASIAISRQIGVSGWFKGISLDAAQNKSDGYVGIDIHQKEMIGKTGVAYTVLRPSGKVMIDNELFDSKSEIGYIEKGEPVKVIRDEAGQLYVIKP